MALTPIRFNAPLKGWNSITPIREMSPEYAVRLENVWFDQAGGANKRPGQTTFDSAAPAASTFRQLFEHYSITGVSTLFCSMADNNVYSLSGAAWSAVAALAGVFTAKPRIAQLGNVLVAGDGVAVRSYNGTAWATPTGVNPMSSLCVYNGRMYGTGNPADIGIIYYSTPVTTTGATDWSTGAGGGFISAYGALSKGEKVVAVQEFQGYLTAFCSNSIIFYQGSDPNDPATFRVAKTIKGIGCFSADSIQGIGNDLIFLSNYGFKSLKEILVRGDAAAFETSFPINNYVIEQINTGNITNVSSTFAEKYGVYLCTFGSETLAYHTMFQSWASWNGLQEMLFTTQAGAIYTATNRLHTLSHTVSKDLIDGDTAGKAIAWVVEYPPFRAGGAEQRARWNRIEVIYEGITGDTITVTTWSNLRPDQQNSDSVTLITDVASGNPTSLLYTDVATTNPRNAWGTATTGPSWGGSAVGLETGDATIPTIGRGELFSVRIENTTINPFKLTALEAYMNVGGLRK